MGLLVMRRGSQRLNIYYYIHRGEYRSGACQNKLVVTRPPCNDKDMGLNPAGTRNGKNRHWEGPLKKVAQWSRQDLSGRLAM